MKEPRVLKEVRKLPGRCMREIQNEKRASFLGLGSVLARKSHRNPDSKVS
jgi:hypothetical protein